MSALEVDPQRASQVESPTTETRRAVRHIRGPKLKRNQRFLLDSSREQGDTM